MTIPLSDECRRPLWDGLALQSVLAVLSLLVLDGGDTARLSGVALAAFWGGALVALLRRPRTPTRLDLWLLRWGCLPLVVGVQILGRSVWHWRGLL